MAEPKKAERLLTVPEVAERCNVSEMTVCRWTSTGMLPTMSLGQLVIRICPKDLEKFIEEWLTPMGAVPCP